jgi:hypothetical protein
MKSIDDDDDDDDDRTTIKKMSLLFHWNNFMINA